MSTQPKRLQKRSKAAKTNTTHGGERKGAGPKAKFIRPDEMGVEMTRLSFRIRTDIAEQIVDESSAAGMSKDEWLMRKVSPQWMAILDAWRTAKAK